MSRKSVLFSRLSCGLVVVLGLTCGLDAWAGLSVSPSAVTGTIHYSPVPPALTVTGPAAFVNTQTPSLTGNLNAPGNLSVNGVNVPLGPDHSFNYELSLDAETNVFTLVGVDTGGNRTVLTRTVTLDNTAPSAPNGTLINVIASSTQATFNGVPSSTEPGTLITLTNQTTGATVSVTSDGTTGAFTAILPGPFLTGDHVTVTARDEADNISDETTLVIFVDTTPPAVPRIGFISAGPVGSDGETTITGTSDAVDPSIQINITNQNGGASITFISDTNGAFPPGEKLTALPSDVLKIVATDAAGNSSIAYIQVPGFDSTPPVVTLTPQPPSYSVTTSNTYTFTGAVSEPVTLKIDGTVVPVNPDLTFRYTTTLQPRDNNINVLAFDNAGNVNANTGFFDIFFDLPPTITITSNPHTGLQNFAVTGKITGLGLFSGNSEVTVDGVTAPFTWTAADQSYHFSATIPLQQEGRNDISVSATDDEGVNATITTAVYLNTGAPGITVTSPSLIGDGQNPYTITGQLDKETLDNTLTVTYGGQSYSALLNPDLSFSFTLPQAFPADDSYIIDLTAVDSASNQGSKSFTVRLDSQFPAITINNEDGTSTNQGSVTLTGHVSEALSQLTVFDGDTVLADLPLPVGPDYAFSYTLSVDNGTLHQGDNEFRVNARDLIGYTSSATWTITVDSQQPTINPPLISAADVGGVIHLIGAPGAIGDSPDDNVYLTLSSAVTSDSMTAVANSDGSFDVPDPLFDVEQPFNITAVDTANNSDSTRVQLGTACYTGSTHVSQIAVGTGTGTVTGPQGGAVVFHVTRTGVLGFDTYLDYRTVDGTAVDGTDYVGGAGSFKIPAGAASADLSIPLMGADAGTGSKTFSLDVLGAHNPIGVSGVAGDGTDYFNRTQRDQFNVGNFPAGIATADFNGDGKPDVIVANNNYNPQYDPAHPENGPAYFAGTISVLVNNTADAADHATFLDQQTFDTGLGPTDAEVADVNADEKPDVIVANGADGNFMVFINTTEQYADTVTFAADPQVVQTAAGPYYLAVADVNADNKPDLVVASWESNSLQVFLNNTGQDDQVASFAATPTVEVSIPEPDGLAVGDLNNDGLPDVVVTDENSGQSVGGVTVLLNTTAAGTVNFAVQAPIDVDAEPADVVIADINDDGLPDLGVATMNGEGTTDADGNQLNNSISVLLQTSPATQTPSFGVPTKIPVGLSPVALTVADLNSDTKPDLVAGNLGDDTLSVLINNTGQWDTTPSFAAQSVYGAGPGPWPVIAADINHDQKPDMVAVNAGTTVSVLLNTFGIPGETVYLPNGSCAGPASVTGTVNYDLVAPVITIASPVGTSFESPYQVLSGNVSGAATATLNGENLPLNADGTFSRNITLQTGVNTYELAATSALGVTSRQTLALTLGNPSLPAPGSGAIQVTGSSGQVTITGTAPAGATGVTILDITTGSSGSGPVGSGGSYSVTITNASQSDSFSVTFTGDNGAQSAPVSLQGNDPDLSISMIAPCSGTTCDVSGDVVSIAGSFTGPVGTGITVAGVPARLSGGNFYLDNLPLNPGMNVISVVATTTGGLSASRTVQINSSGITDLVLKATSDVMGLAPLAVTFTYSFQGTGTIQQVKMSYLGDGHDDVDSDNPADVILTHTYTAPGVYPATLTLVDTDGNQYQAQTRVVVQDPSAIDANVRRVWTSFASALARGDRATAMTYLNAQTQETYAPVFDALLAQLPGIVSNFSPPIQSSIAPDGVEYVIAREENGQQVLHFVYFSYGADGVWRIDTM